MQLQKLDRWPRGRTMRFANASSELAIASVSLSPSHALCQSLLTAAALFSPKHVRTSVLDWKAPNSNFDHIMVFSMMVFVFDNIQDVCLEHTIPPNLTTHRVCSWIRSGHL